MDRYNLPNTVKVYSQIIMDKNVSESRNGPPVNLGMKCLQIFTYPLGRFGEGLEITQNSVLNQLRLAKGILAVLAIVTYAPDAIDDVKYVEAVIPHNGIAS